MSLKSRALDWLLPLALDVPLRLLRHIRFSLHAYPRTRAMLNRVGVFPVVDHYYDPLIDTRNLTDPTVPRSLPGIDFNRSLQRELLKAFAAAPSPQHLQSPKANAVGFDISNDKFSSGDAELWFHMILHAKPKRIIEVGCGHSTQVAKLALDELRRADPSRHISHLCIDPYPPQWLHGLGPEVRVQRLEHVAIDVFAALTAGDILFIDSSHVIRPQGDVLRAYLNILPLLAPGVIVHIHDVFTPRDYPLQWLHEAHYFWNEQYLVEAFLSHNTQWQIMLAANMMFHEERTSLERCCPSLNEALEPRSLYVRKVR